MVKVLKVSQDNPQRNVIDYVIDVLRKGGIAVYPTDTVYGVGGDPFNEDVVERIFSIKKRGDKPLPLLVSSIKDVMEIAYVSDTALQLMENFWPGPLTLILPVKKEFPFKITFGTGKIGVRMPNHKIPLLLAEGLGGAIIGTSANISGHPAPRSAEEALRELDDLVDIVLDAGPTPGGVPSTVVEIINGEIRILREGPITLKDLMSVLRKHGLAENNT